MSGMPPVTFERRVADLMEQVWLLSDPDLIEPVVPSRGPDYVRIRQWQAEVQPGVEEDAEKQLVTDEALKAVPAPPKKTAWHKLIENLRRGERKKRRIQEFDAIIRKEIEQPVGDTTEPEMWKTAIAEVTQEEREGYQMSLQDALELLEPPSSKEESITALPPIPSYLQKKKKEVFRPLPESELRLFAPGMM